MQKKDIWNSKHKTSIGGEAVIEGVMMRGPRAIAIAIRKQDGSIAVEKKDYKPVSSRHRLLGLPVIRGMVGFFESLVIGMKSLMRSAEYVEIEEEDEKPSKIDNFLERVLGDKLQDALIYFSVLVAVVLGVGLFILLPHFIAGLSVFGGWNPTILNLFEGLIRIIIFLVYISLVSKLKDIQRVFQYHGAEHKTIHCYENEEELTVENVKKYSTMHPRCGTSFLLVVMIVSILVFSFLGWKSSIIMRVVPRLLLLPVVAGLSYEVIKFAGRSKSRLVRIMNIPGLALQKFTTREPDDSQIEVAINALKNVMVDDREADRW